MTASRRSIALSGRVGLSGRYPLAAVAGALALAVGVPGVPGPPGQPAGTAPPAGTVWAVNTSGREVPVPPPTFAPTPVHPEKITHPGADYMGAVNIAHAPWGHAAPVKLAAPAVPQRPGIDISVYQGIINWASVAPHIDFSYAKATEGRYYTNPNFTNQYNGPYNHGLIRGAYHFAIPNNSTGKAQADFFINHGGGWSSDGRTLPGALDIEYNPYGGECYGFTHARMVTWLRNFINEYAFREHTFPVIYTTTDWWSTCTGNYAGFAANVPLWIARYAATAGTLPHGWGFYTFWQYSSSGSLPGDQDVFNGSKARLKALAKG